MFTPQYLNLVNSSFLLFLEHQILEKGSGFVTGVNSRYYPIGRTYNNYYVYASPVQPQICDESITSPMTGVYVGSTFYQRGEGNFVDIDYKNNRTIFNAPVNNVSGIFPLNDINILSLDISEEKLLFETKLKLRNQNSNIIPSNYTGLLNDEKSYPAIYVKSEGLVNKPFAFGGQDETAVNVGVFIFSDSKYQLDSVCSIINDMKLEYFALLTPDKMPFNVFGGLKNTGNNYNYTTLNTGYLAQNSGVYIRDVTINYFNRFYSADFMKMNPDVYYAIGEFDLCRPRLSRQGGI